MSSILDALTQQLGGDATRQVSRQLGTAEDGTGTAVAQALPVLVSALSRNASRPGGAEALTAALERDHDGGILDDLAGALGSPDRGTGAGILRHVLGGRRGAVEQGLARSSGLDGAAVGGLLETLAPIVMGALGKARRDGRLDATSLQDVLAGDRRRVESAPETGSVLTQLLDSDGDGSALDDVARTGLGMLGKFLNRD